MVFGRLHLERRVFRFPVRDEFIQSAGLQHRAREQMRADFRPFFKDAYGFGRIELFYAYGTGQASWPRPHDDNIVVHNGSIGADWVWHMALLDLVCYDYDIQTGL